MRFRKSDLTFCLKKKKLLKEEEERGKQGMRERRREREREKATVADPSGSEHEGLGTPAYH